MELKDWFTLALLPAGIALWEVLKPYLHKWGESRLKRDEIETEATLEDRRDSREYQQRMNEARFEATQTDRALERSAQIAVSETLADMLKGDIAFNQLVIRHLLKMPLPPESNDEVFDRLAKALGPDTKDASPDE